MDDCVPRGISASAFASCRWGRRCEGRRRRGRPGDARSITCRSATCCSSARSSRAEPPWLWRPWPSRGAAAAGRRRCGGSGATSTSRAGGDVRFIGFVPAADLSGLYAGAEVFCYPSEREGYGLPVLEAMAQGTPVVTSRGTATEETAGGGRAGRSAGSRRHRDLRTGISRHGDGAGRDGRVARVTVRRGLGHRRRVVAEVDGDGDCARRNPERGVR